MGNFIKQFMAERFGENSTIALLTTAFITGVSTGITTGDPLTALMCGLTNSAFAFIPDKYIEMIKTSLQGIEAKNTKQ